MKPIRISHRRSRNLNRIERPSLKEMAVDRIRDAIMRGDLERGQPISEIGLARELGVGQATIREALVDLSHLGFVAKPAARKTIVSSMTRLDVDQFYRVRIPLERVAVELIVENGAADLRDVERCCRQMAEGAENQDATAFKDADLGFHRALWAAAGNRYLESSLERLVPPLFAFTMAKLSEYQPSGAALAEMARWHNEILRLLRMRDKAGAIAALEASMDTTWVDGLDLP